MNSREPNDQLPITDDMTWRVEILYLLWSPLVIYFPLLSFYLFLMLLRRITFSLDSWSPHKVEWSFFFEICWSVLKYKWFNRFCSIMAHNHFYNLNSWEYWTTIFTFDNVVKIRRWTERTRISLYYTTHFFIVLLQTLYYSV